MTELVKYDALWRFLIAELERHEIALRVAAAPDVITDLTRRVSYYRTACDMADWCARHSAQIQAIHMREKQGRKEAAEDQA